MLLVTSPDVGRRGVLAPLARALVADTAPGVPWREDFVERFMPAPAVGVLFPFPDSSSQWHADRG